MNVTVKNINATESDRMYVNTILGTFKIRMCSEWIRNGLGSDMYKRTSFDINHSDLFFKIIWLDWSVP